MGEGLGLMLLRPANPEDSPAARIGAESPDGARHAAPEDLQRIAGNAAQKKPGMSWCRVLLCGCLDMENRAFGCYLRHICLLTLLTSMKNLLAGLLMATTSTLALAQDNSLVKGKFFVGGNLGYSTQTEKYEYKTGGTTLKTDGPKSTSFTVMPTIGYMLSKDLAAGAGIGFTMNRVKEDADGAEETTTNNALVFAPNLSYFMPLGGSQRFGFMANAAIPISIGTTKHEMKYSNSTVSHKSNNRSFGLAVSPGIYYFPASRFMLSAQMGNFLRFTSTTMEDKNDDVTEKTTQNRFEVFNFSTMGLSFGGSYFF